MRVLVIGGLVTIASVVGLRLAFDPGPTRELCKVASISPDQRFQIEEWSPATMNPLALRIYGYGACEGRGWIVLRDRATGAPVAEVATDEIWWSTSDRDVDWQPRTIAIELRRDTVHLELPADLASISARQRDF